MDLHAACLELSGKGCCSSFIQTKLPNSPGVGCDKVLDNRNYFQSS